MPAIWTAPRDWLSGEIVTPALMNAHVRDNLSWLKTPTSAVKVITSDVATTSTSFVDVTGSSVSITTNGGNVLCLLNACYTASTSLTLQLRFMQDGSPTAQLAQMTNPTTTGQMVTCLFLFQPSTGAHTYVVQHKTTAGTITMAGSSIANATFSVIETGWLPG